MKHIRIMLRGISRMWILWVAAAYASIPTITRMSFEWGMCWFLSPFVGILLVVVYKAGEQSK